MLTEVTLTTTSCRAARWGFVSTQRGCHVNIMHGRDGVSNTLEEDLFVLINLDISCCNHLMVPRRRRPQEEEALAFIHPCLCMDTG